MPYIDQKRRSEFVLGRVEGESPEIKSVGELNYLITSLCILYQEQHGLSYQTVNDIVGALESAKLEFYRRVAVPYENVKISSNGDVY